ncbi:MAG: hypothetical protein NTX57_06895 [Armatimonadetes bacterium]|nr:hypothetical protein [Armatimonadota bacterium]
MHIGRLLGCLFGTLLYFAGSVRAQPPQRLTATLDRAGTLTVRVANSQRVFATIRPGIFEAMWQYRTTVAASTPGAARIRTRTLPASIAVTFESTLEATSDRNVRLKYTLTPDKDIKVNSAHVAVLTGTEWWTKAKAALGEREAIVDEQAPKQGNLLAGEGGLSLTRQGVTLSVETKDQPALLQDNRAFNARELELRFGKQSPEAGGRLWKAGQPETFELLISFPSPIALIREEPLTITAGEDWIALDESSAEITPGSALDFSSLLDAPAGKLGRVVVSGGHFGFEKGTKPQRFWGANLCFGANYLEKPDSDKLAERLARLGYNSVRVHHFDGEALNAASLDKLDYLIAALKKRGLYIKTDLYVSRPVPDTIALGDFKAAIFVSDAALGNWKDFTKALLNHVNPYTQLAWKDEPAIGWLSVVNESNLTNGLAGFKPELMALLDKEWQAWRKGRGLAPAALPRQAGSDKVGREVGAFFTLLHERGYAKMKAFIREQGCKALLTDMNGWSESPAFMAARTSLDFVDNHFYWDHPRFLETDWQLPSEGYQEGASAIGSGGTGPSNVAMTRLFGKPFTVSEFNYTAPNPHRSEGGLIMGAAAGLQDWDGVWRFAYSHSKESAVAPGALSYFDLANDPVSLASDRAGILLFTRGDVRPAPGAVSRHLRRDELLTKPELAVSPGFGELALVTRVGTWIEDASGPLAPPRPVELRLTKGESKDALAQLFQTNRLPESNRTNFDTQERQSETGEVFVNGQFGSIRIVTPRTLGGVCPEGDAIKCGPLRIAAEGTEAMVYVSSLDGKPVSESGRLLVAHVTDIQNTGARYSTSNRRILESWGTLPHLAKRGTANLTLTRKLTGKVEAWRLDTSGNRLTPLAAKLTGTELTLPLTTLGPDGKATIYYEVVIKGATP